MTGRSAVGTFRRGARLPRRLRRVLRHVGALAVGMVACAGAAEPRVVPVALEHTASGAPLGELGGGGTGRTSFLPIDPARTYTFRGYLRTRDADRKARVWLSLLYFDRNRELIKPWSVWPLRGTETVLARDLPQGAMPKDHLPEGWSLHPPYLYAMAFNVREDLSDLPNLEAVLMDRAVARDYPAGTPVRLHRYTDFPSVGGVVTPVWTLYSLKVAGQAPPTEPARRSDGVPQFWHGAAFLRIEIRSQDSSGGVLLFDDLQILEE